MLNINPLFYIFDPSFLGDDIKRTPFIFGGIEVTPPYRGSNLTKEMSAVLRRIKNSIEQAYPTRMGIYTFSNNFISTQVSPVAAPIEKNCEDFSIGEYPKQNRGLAKFIFQRLNLTDRDTGLFYHDKGFYVIHRLKEELDALETEVLLKTIKSNILVRTYNKFRITSTISGGILRVDAEIIPTIPTRLGSELYIV